MKRLFTTALACAFAVSLAAQAGAAEDPATPQDQPAAEQPAQDPAPAPDTSSDTPSDEAVGTSGSAETPAGSISVTGCLSGSEDNWQLTNAKKEEAGAMGSPSPSGSTAGGPAPGAAGAGAAAAAGETYSLKVANNDELKAHVGHKIQVTGTLDQASSMASGSSTDQPVGTAGAGSAAGAAKKLNVSSVKMVSGSCE
jgi:hypothetical protein